MELGDYDWVVLNSSAGKDSQTMIDYVWGMAQNQGYPLNQIVVAHADLGRMEWEGTRDLAERQAQAYGLRFEAVKRPQGDLLTHIRQRGMWPSSTTRYCTSDHKRGQIGKIITQLTRERSIYRHTKILNCMGLRAEESPARAKKPQFKVLERLCTRSRTVHEWLPIHDWTFHRVWKSIRQSGVEHHHAYDLGMPRLSCIFCIFAPRPALILAGEHNPELLQEYVQVEQEIHHTFRHGFTIRSIQDAIAQGEQVGAMDGAWNM